MPSRYAVLRCPPATTLDLAKSLYQNHGLPVWAPRMLITMRLPRGRPKRTLIKPLMPSFLFVQEGHADETERRAYPKVRPFVMNAERVTVGLNELKEIECPERPQEPVLDTGAPLPGFHRGDKVTVSAGPFRGMHGVVTAILDDYLEVRLEKIPGRLKIPPFMLKFRAI